MITEPNINGVADFLDCLMFFAICAAFCFVGFVIVCGLLKKLIPSVWAEWAKIRGAKSLLKVVVFPLQVIGEPVHLAYRVFWYAKEKKWYRRDEVSAYVPYLFSAPMFFFMAMIFLGINLMFYGYVEQRKSGGVGGNYAGFPARQAYEQALARSIKESNRKMNFNQDILDAYNNRKDKEETHPVWHMRNFPDISNEDARKLYCTVMEEEGWSMAGMKGPRLEWADQLRTRAGAVWKEKNWQSDTYKDNLRKKGIKVGSLDEPSW